MTPRSRRALAASTLLAAAAAAIASLSQLPPVPNAERPVPPGPAATIPKAHSVEPLETYRAISERPLFSPSRRPLPPPLHETNAPPPAAAISPPSPPKSLPKLLLLAVAIAPDRREAVLRLPTGKSSTMCEGDVIDDWVVKKILPDRIVFSLADREQELAFPAAQESNAARPPFPVPVNKR